MIIKKLANCPSVMYLINFNAILLKAQSVDINVQGEIYEYATYYVSSFDVTTGATNVQIFNYSLESKHIPCLI